MYERIRQKVKMPVGTARRPVKSNEKREVLIESLWHVPVRSVGNFYRYFML